MVASSQFPSNTLCQEYGVLTINAGLEAFPALLWTFYPGQERN